MKQMRLRVFRVSQPLKLDKIQGEELNEKSRKVNYRVECTSESN